LCPYDEEEPAIWFCLIQGQFAAAGIRSLSRCLLNPYGEIGSGYPTMSMMEVGSRFLYLDKDGAVRCMMFIDCQMVVVMGIKIPGIQLQYQNRKTH
jgi:hypothetical protein